MPENRILILAQDLLECLDDPQYVVVDCRFDLGDPDAGRRVYEEGHIPGAVFLDLDRNLAGPVTPETGRHPLPDPAALAATLGDLGIGESHRVIVYDAGPGAIAARAWWVLRWLGHDAVYLLDGGLAHWQAIGMPIEGGDENPSATVFNARVRNGLVLGTEELAENLAAISELNLLDARDAPRFRGELEPIDPVAGHIPGSINLPFAKFVNEDGTWRPLPERAALLENHIGTDRSVHWNVMCGSGVTACHLAISGLEAGFQEPRLYVGSWSEWIRDPQRPIAVSDT
jgi:thiosulfate/3-mercaptopyruvate sulfurtransferase